MPSEEDGAAPSARWSPFRGGGLLVRHQSSFEEGVFTRYLGATLSTEVGYRTVLLPLERNPAGQAALLSHPYGDSDRDLRGSVHVSHRQHPHAPSGTGMSSQDYGPEFPEELSLHQSLHPPVHRTRRTRQSNP